MQNSPLPTTLPPLRSTVTPRRRRGARASGSRSGTAAVAAVSSRAVTELALDESERSLPVH
jgi:hypothetical protein